MGIDTRLVLTSFEDGRAVVDVHYGDRRARLELDQIEDRYPGQPTEERAREEVRHLAEALRTWLDAPGVRIEPA